jgi:SPP1 gp7 family putative phage head morphogenesis protein
MAPDTKKGELAEKKVVREIHLFVPRAYPSIGITPEELTLILKQADAGLTTLQFELFREMEEKDAQIASLLQTRKLAVLSLPYEIVPADDTPEAKKACMLVKEWIAAYPFEELMMDLLDAIGKGVSVVELIWEYDGKALLPKKHYFVEPRFLKFTDEQGFPLERPRVLTPESPIAGIELSPGKFVCFIHKARSGLAGSSSILRPVAYLYVIKKYVLSDWAIYTERFATPMRIGKYSTGAGEEEIEVLWQALRSLAVDAAAVISENTTVELLEVAQRGDVKAFKELVEYCDRQMAKAILGQTLTSDTSPHGTLATAKVHEEVRKDLLKADARALSCCIRKELFSYIVKFNLGEVPVPKLVFNTEEPENLEKTAKIFATLVRDVGVQIPQEFVYEKFGIPSRKQKENEAQEEDEQEEDEGEYANREECFILSEKDWVEICLQKVKEMTPQIRESALKEIEEWLRSLPSPPSLEELQFQVQKILKAHYAKLSNAEIPIMQMLISFGKEVENELGLGISFNLADEPTLQYVSQNQPLLYSTFITNQDAAEKLQKIIEQLYLEEGFALYYDIDKAIKIIRERLGEALKEIEDYQLKRIVQTEVVRLKNLARLYAYEKAGVKKLVVVEVLDMKTCGRCRSMHGRVISTTLAKLGADHRWSLPGEAQYALNPSPEEYRTNLRNLLLSGYGVPPYHPHCRGRIIAYYEPKKEKYPASVEGTPNEGQRRAIDWWNSIHPDFREDLVKTVQEHAEWRPKLLKRHAHVHWEVAGGDVEKYAKKTKMVIKEPDRTFIKVDDRGRAFMIFTKEWKRENWQVVMVNVDGKTGQNPTIVTSFGPDEEHPYTYGESIKEGERSEGWVEIKKQ